MPISARALSPILLVLALPLGVCGCPNKGDEKPPSTSAANTGATAAPTQTGGAGATSATGGFASAPATADPGGGGFKPTFSRGAIKPIDGCTQDTYVMIETAAAKSTRTIASLLTPLRLFKIGSFKAEPGALEIRVFRASAEEREDSPNTIVAKCGTPDTCNEVAAYLSHARVFPKPQLYCGRPTFFGAWDGSTSWGPIKLTSDEIEPLCARVAACRYDADPSLPPKLFNDCAKSPVQGKAPCGMKSTCAEVLECVGK